MILIVYSTAVDRNDRVLSTPVAESWLVYYIRILGYWIRVNLIVGFLSGVNYV